MIQKKIFNSLNTLQETIFIVYLKRDYVQHRIFYDKKLHDARTSLMKIMQKTRSVFTAEQIVLFEQITEILLSLNQLKLRIHDHVTFEVSEQEFRLLMVSLREIFSLLADGKQVDFINLEKAIMNLQEINQTALQVITYDPSVFIFFLHDLRDLQKCLERAQYAFKQ